MAVVPVVVRRWESPHKVFFFILLATHPLDLSFSPLWEGGGRGGGRGYAVHFFFLSTLSLVASQGSIRRRRRRRWSSFFSFSLPTASNLCFVLFLALSKKKNYCKLVSSNQRRITATSSSIAPSSTPFFLPRRPNFVCVAPPHMHE